MTTQETMPALVWEGPRQMVMREQERPEPEADEVVIRVAYAGICGSELSGYLGHNALRVPPLVMGHEFSGEIVALGEEVSGLRLGQAVTANPMVYCGHCEFCQQGLNHLCTQRRLISVHSPGAFAGYVRVPAQQVIPLPEGVDLQAGALAEPVACAVRIGEWAGAMAGQDVLVIGAGAIGLLALQVLQEQGAARVFAVDTNAARLEVAAALGAEALDPQQTDVVAHVRDATGGRGVPVAVDAVGKSVTRAQCIAAVLPRGTVILSGLHEETGPIPVADVIRREITLRGSFCYTPADFERAVALLARDAVGLAPWVVTAPLAEGGQWFETLISGPGGIAKVLLEPKKEK